MASMKDPKVVFPYVFASSWLGNLLLTILAFYLAFSQEEPLAPFVLFTVAFCILSGNLLPIGTWYAMLRWRKAELDAESAEASLHVREALKRAEEVMGRLDEAEGALAKVLLVARQVPERIAEQQKPLTDLLERMDSLEIESFTQALSGQTGRLTEIRDALDGLKKRIVGFGGELESLPGAVESRLVAALPAPPDETSEADVSLNERLDLVYESLESVQDSLDGLLERIAHMAQTETTPRKKAEPATERVPDPSISEVAQTGETPSVANSPEAEDPPEPAPVPASAQGEMQLDSLEEAKAVEEEPDALPPDTVELVIQAMVGISNKLYIRGDGPSLSWDQGCLMELIGIGEFAWRGEHIKEPIEVSVRLNDEIETEGGRFILKPGKAVRAHLEFPRNRYL